MTSTEALIKAAVPTAKVVIPDALLDLSSFADVRNYAQSLQKLPSVDVLVNDAGMANNPHQLKTKDGFEMAFQIDYPSQWLLTYLLLPRLRKAKGRIVNLSSKAYRMACPMAKRFQCMQLENLPPPVITGSQKVPVLGIPVSNYGIARLLMIRWTEDLAHREAENGVIATTVNPGFVNTSMADSHNLSPVFRKLACATDGRPGAPCPTLPAQGALTPTFLALAPTEKIDNGKYYEWCETAPVNQCLDVLDGPWIPTQCAGEDQKYKDGLWDLTAKWVENFTAPLAEPSTALQEAVDSDVTASLAFAVAAEAASPCDLACNKVTKALTCTAGCKGIDVGICKGSKYILCKGGCLGIHKCVKKCEDKLVKPCMKKLVDECDDKCVEKVVKPCQEGCDRDGLKICEEVVSKAAVFIGNKTVGVAACGELCTEAAALADAAGAGPEDPFADAVAAAIEVGCNPVCQRAISKYVLQPLSKPFAQFVCKGIGFTTPGIEEPLTISV
jgi:NAD(P)-dependent dehydrogenase (short-subunit alcohol dehydrogenase family)